MRISINLATRPFVELRPLFARLRLAMAGLALLAVVLGFGLHSMNVRARAAQAQMDVLKAQTRTLEMERQTNEARMHEPQNRAVLDRSQFLNTLFASKSFSWTAVMMDLEGVLPAGVQVTSIEPSITPERNINIRLRVNGPRELEVDLVRNLERSQRFLSPQLTTETAQMQDQGRLTPVAQTGVPVGVQFDIFSGYNPLPLEMKAAKGPAESGKAAPAGAKAGTLKAGAQRAGAQKPAGAVAPARKKASVPGVASKPATAKKPGKAGVPGVVH
jgi:type IV pilus assembly protein PilN